MPDIKNDGAGELFAKADDVMHTLMVQVTTTEGHHITMHNTWAAEIRDVIAALQARIAELEARNAASERLLKEARPAVWHAMAAAVNVPIEQRMEDLLRRIDAHAQGQAGEEKDG